MMIILHLPSNFGPVQDLGSDGLPALGSRLEQSPVHCIAIPLTRPSRAGHDFGGPSQLEDAWSLSFAPRSHRSS